MNQSSSSPVELYIAADTAEFYSEVPRQRDFVTTKVIDQGQGIPKNESPHVFNPLQKAMSKSTTGENSTRRGLYIVEKIVEGHQGIVGLKAKLEKAPPSFSSCPS